MFSKTFINTLQKKNPIQGNMLITNMIRITILTALLTIPFSKGQNQSINVIKKETIITKKFDIYLLIGQSNMGGRAKPEGLDKDTLKNVYIFTEDTLHPWEPAAVPLNKYSTIRQDLKREKLGPGYHFARVISEVRNNRAIGLVENSRGGSSMNEWMPGTHYYKEAVRRTHNALKYGNLKAILWHQGESDVSKYEQYLPKIICMIDSLRIEFKNPDLPFIAGELAEVVIPRANFNKELRKLPSLLKGTAVASSEALTTIDSTHYDTRSQRIFGERYAIELFKLWHNYPSKKLNNKLKYASNSNRDVK